MTGETFNNQSSHPRVALLVPAPWVPGWPSACSTWAFQSACGIEHLAGSCPGRARCDRPRTSDRRRGCRRGRRDPCCPTLTPWRCDAAWAPRVVRCGPT